MCKCVCVCVMVPGEWELLSKLPVCVCMCVMNVCLFGSVVWASLAEEEAESGSSSWVGARRRRGRGLPMVSLEIHS